MGDGSFATETRISDPKLWDDVMADVASAMTVSEQARRREGPVSYCAYCGKVLRDTRRRTRRFCSTRCRVAAHRADPAQ
jgi:hypothetical protein